MHADGAVDELGDMQVDGGTGEHVGIFAGHVLFGHQKSDGLAHRDFQGFREVFVQAHGDEAELSASRYFDAVQLSFKQAAWADVLPVEVFDLFGGSRVENGEFFGQAGDFYVAVSGCG